MNPSQSLGGHREMLVCEIFNHDRIFLQQY